MRKAEAGRRLRALGYEIDWSCTGSAEGYWSGCFDGIGRTGPGGECRGEVVHGDNAADWYRAAVAAAEQYGKAQPCPYPPGECAFHDEET